MQDSNRIINASLALAVVVLFPCGVKAQTIYPVYMAVDNQKTEHHIDAYYHGAKASEVIAEFPNDTTMQAVAVTSNGQTIYAATEALYWTSTIWSCNTKGICSKSSPNFVTIVAMAADDEYLYVDLAVDQDNNNAHKSEIDTCPLSSFNWQSCPILVNWWKSGTKPAYVATGFARSQDGSYMAIITSEYNLYSMDTKSLDMVYVTTIPSVTMFGVAISPPDSTNSTNINIVAGTLADDSDQIIQYPYGTQFGTMIFGDFIMGMHPMSIAITPDNQYIYVSSSDKNQDNNYLYECVNAPTGQPISCNQVDSFGGEAYAFSIQSNK